jgi:Bax protein
MKIFISLLLIKLSLFSFSLPQNYYEIKDVKKMKKEFFSFIKEIALIENQKILDDRIYIKNNFTKKEKRLKQLQKRYGLKDNATMRDYLYVIDIVPISLVLSQSAIESGWGKSRFFKKAKNIFGQWTWTGKGLDPLKRASNKKHKIKIFSSFQHSVKAYLININKGWGYKDLRDLRQIQRDKNEKLSGNILAQGLIKYSQKREEYIKILKKFINGNKLYVEDVF